LHKNTKQSHLFSAINDSLTVDTESLIDKMILHSTSEREREREKFLVILRKRYEKESQWRGGSIRHAWTCMEFINNRVCNTFLVISC
jgi:hypothetical protein